MDGRPGLLTRLCAVCVLLLALSPLTAPFSTLDLATLSGHVSPHESSKLKTKPPTEGASLPVAMASVLAPPERAPRDTATRPHLTERLQAECGVLRI
jgi:hypothetical protein